MGGRVRVSLGSLVTIVAALAAVNAVLLLRASSLKEMVASRFDRASHAGHKTHGEMLGADPVSDPALGADLPNTTLGRRVRKVSLAPNGCVLAALSDCSACTRFDWQRWAEDGKRLGFSVVAISGSTQKEIDRYAEGKGLAVFRDPNMKLHRQIGATWNGRLYFYGPDWRLRWIMKESEGGNHLAGLPELERVIRSVDSRH